MNRLLLAGMGVLFSYSAFAAVLYDLPFKAESELKGVITEGKEPASVKVITHPEYGNVLEVSVPEKAENARCAAQLPLEGKNIAGKRVIFEAEVKTDLNSLVKKWGAGWFTIYGYVPKGKKVLHSLCFLGNGKAPWKKYRHEVDFPDYVTNGRFGLAINDARGKIYFRNVKVESTATLLTLNESANMGFADETAGDKKGGWHDQGPDHDASRFPIKNKTFANVPFKIIDPKTNNGKSIVVFECPKLPGGPKSAEVKLPAGTTGKYLYLLHCSAWGQPNETNAGTILLEGTNGKTAEIPVVYGRDLAEWWGGKGAGNAVVGTRITANAGMGAAYVSRFDIPAEIGRIAKVTFRKQPDANAMWMLIGATISDVRYQYPQMKKLVMKENGIWKPLPQDIFPVPKAGTALDFSVFYPKHEAGEFGRVVIGKNGHFEFEKRPGKPVRFISACMGRDFGPYFGTKIELDDKKMIERYADQIQRAGYNLIRFWASGLKDNGIEKGEGWSHNKAYQFSPGIVDRMDYFVYCLKKRGVYVMISIQIATFPYDHCYPYGKTDWDLYLNPVSMDSWYKSTEKVLTHRNPYTGMRWIDDPQIAMIDCNNEQEFCFMRGTDKYAPLFRKFLKAKYKDFSMLKKAWGKDAEKLNGFEDIKTFHLNAGPSFRDRAEFATEQEKGLYEREHAFLRKLGFKGAVTSFTLGRSMRYAGVRKNFDFVSMNGYHTHPIGGDVMRFGSVPQVSSVGVAANIIRSFNGTRLYGKPFVVSEHGHTFWNRYRYEQGFIMGGYAALNGYDALTAFFMPVTTHQSFPMTTFEIRHDPISRAAELITNLLFRRGDVKTSSLVSRIKLNADDPLGTNANEAVNASQLQMALLGQCFVDMTDKPFAKNELIMARTGSSAMAVRRADANIVDTKDRTFDLDTIVKMLKKRGLLLPNNRTNMDKQIYESSTGELYMDSSRNFMTVNTARFQGLCGEAGSKASLPNFELKKMNRRGCVAVASIDGDKPLNESKRMLLFLMTNALNTGMTFENDDQLKRIKNGTTPLLLETGTFTIAVKNRNTDKMKLYALALDGTRIDEIPVKKIDGGIEFTINTAKIKNGPAIYFELI